MARSTQALTATLKSPITNSDTEILVSWLNDIYGQQIRFVGDIMYGTLEPQSSNYQEIIWFTGIVPVDAFTSRLTGCIRWLKAQPDVGTMDLGADAGLARSHGWWIDFILSNNPQFYDGLATRDEDETISGDWDFTGHPTTTAPVDGTGIANKDFVENIALAGAPDSAPTIKGVARLTESPNVSLGTVTVTIAWPAVFSLTSHGLTVNDSVQFTTDGALPTGLSLLTNYYVISTGLTSGQFQVSTTLWGAAVATSGTQSGTHTAIKTTPIAVGTNDAFRILTQNEKNAAKGTSWTPSDTNRFVTDQDTWTSWANKVLRLDGTGKLPALNGSQLTWVGNSTITATASWNIAQMDSVYVTAANTVKSVYPSAMGTGASISTAASHNSATKSLPLSTNGTFLHISWWTSITSRLLYAQVRTINAGETDFTNGSEATVYWTGNGTRAFDVCSIGTDKFLFIWQSDTAAAAAGIKAVVCTVSWTTITVWTPVTIETTGTLASIPTCCKLDTDKALLTYYKDSDTNIYTQVITVSTTTISTNTPVQVKATTSDVRCWSTQLGTDSAAVFYNSGWDVTKLYWVTVSVSGTVPTVNSENTIVTIGGWSDQSVTVRTISSTKLLLIYSEAAATNDKCAHVAISGSTMTLSSTINLNSTKATLYCWMVIIGTKYAIVADQKAASYTLFLLDITWTAPVSLSSQDLSVTSHSTDIGYSIVKISPWTYVAESGGSAIFDGDYIVKLTPQSNRIGIAESAISDTASGLIKLRYQLATLSGLTAGSTYYVDDTAQPTTKTSMTAPTLGIAISTTSILTQ